MSDVVNGVKPLLHLLMLSTIYVGKEWEKTVRTKVPKKNGMFFISHLVI